MSRRDHRCAAINARLGFVDICGQDAATKKQQQPAIVQLVSGLPSDGYGRGATLPVLPNDPTLFYRAATENLCEAIAADVIDVTAAKTVPDVKTWSSGNADAAIADFVSIVMALVPSDPRSAPATTLLKDHFAAAKAQGASASDALKSTFVTACLAPSALSIGLLDSDDYTAAKSSVPAPRRWRPRTSGARDRSTGIVFGSATQSLRRWGITGLRR